MTRKERHIFQNGIVFAAIFIIAAVLVLTASKKAVFAASVYDDEQIPAYSAESPEMAEIRGDSAMPCDNPEAFAAWYEEYQRKANTSNTLESLEAPEIPIYRIAGEDVDEDLQFALYEALAAEGIEYWYEGALAQMFQESHGKRYAENPNGLDKGVMQFRITYWNWSDGDIFDVNAQFRRYAREMASRFGTGLSVDEAISRHKTSDYCTAIDWTYVGHVKQWLNQMEAIK